ncbi:phage tail tube protein [Nocardia testacea]|uniref:phage tail tube protein n=1 Tax=Nocardia testacea TaxID=248551 RepID=UPI003A8532B5
MTTPLQAPDSASMATALARDYAVQIDLNQGTPQAGTPNWVFVMGLNKVSPTTDLTMQDDGDIHSGGRKSQIATGIGENLELGGLRKGNRSPNYVPDPGQEKLRSHGSQIGYDNIAHIRYWRVDEIDEAKEGYFAVNWVSSADDKEGLYAFTATLTGRGKHKDIAKPLAQTVKTFTLPAGTTGGTWTVTVDGETTSGVSNTVTAAALQSALAALANVGADGVTVALAGGVYTATFTVPVTSVTASGSGLTPSGTVEVG